MTTRTDPTPLLPHAARLPDGVVTVRGVVKGVVYRTDDKRYSVLRLTQTHGEETVIVGALGDVAPGESLRLTGRWERHAAHGPQLKVETWIPEMPTSADGIARLLGSGFVKDIGPKLAQRIVERFGASTLDVIADHPERLSEVEGIGGRRAQRIQEVFRVRRAEVETRSFLAGLGVGTGLARRIWERFGVESSAVVRENPYRLAEEVKGIGFLTADAIARAQGVLADDPRRIAGAVLFLLLEAVDDGHTALPPDELAVLADRFSIPPEAVHTALHELAAHRTVIRDQQLVYPPPLYDAEVRLAHDLAAQMRRPLKPVRREALTVPEVREALDRLNARQREAVEATMTAGVVVMTGGPGTGKTTTVLAMVRLHQAAGHKVLLAAPTGRAARRLSEATHHPASTIHRLLDWSPRIQRFSRDRSSPLDADLVLVDEASMVDVQLASHLVAAVRAGARLVLVGDADQLPPVGPGTVLADLLKLPEVTSVRLTEVFRQAAESAIVQGAYEVLRGEVPRSSPPRGPTAEGGGSRAPSGELFLVQRDDGEEAARVLVETVARHIPRSFGLDPMRAVQVLVPTHRGPVGAQKLNEALQAALNPEGVRGRRGFAIGDKVMQLRNDYDLDVSNGDVGLIEQLDEKGVTVRMEGREVRYVDDAVDNLTLAYAATIHKAQGSEYDAVVLGLHTSHFVLLNRALLYTAITRARRLVVIVGSRRALEMAVSTRRVVERHGALLERLRLEFASAR